MMRPPLGEENNADVQSSKRRRTTKDSYRRFDEDCTHARKTLIKWACNFFVRMAQLFLSDGLPPQTHACQVRYSPWYSGRWTSLVSQYADSPNMVCQSLLWSFLMVTLHEWIPNSSLIPTKSQANGRLCFELGTAHQNCNCMMMRQKMEHSNQH